MTIGLPPPEDRAFADVWSALGGELKPSLDLVVTAPMWTGREYPAGPPVEEGVYLDVQDTVDGGTDTRRHQHVPPPREDSREPIAKPSSRVAPARRRRSK